MADEKISRKMKNIKMWSYNYYAQDFYISSIFIDYNVKIIYSTKLRER